MTITLRQETDARASTKGTSLNFQELDNNFIDILNRTEFTVEGDSGNAQLSSAATADRRLVVNGAGGITTSITSDSTGQAVLTVTQGPATVDFENAVNAGTGISVSSPDSTGAVTISNTGITDIGNAVFGTGNITVSQPDSAGAVTISTSAIANVADDASPQLGADLDVNGQDIVSVSNGDIALIPNGTGVVSLGGNVTINSNELRNAKLTDYKEKIYDLGTTSGTITPNVANGNVQTITLSGNLTFNAFTSPEAGQSLTLIIDTNGTSRTLTTTMKTPDATDPTMSVTDTIDICTVFYDGTNYYMNYVTNFA